MDITIRAARPHEFEAAGELTAGAYLRDGLLDFGAQDPYLAVLRDARHRAGHAELLVAAGPVGGGAEEVLGTVTFAAHGGEYAQIARPGEGEFRVLAVRPGARGRGVGETLVRECVDRARALDLERLVLSSHPLMHTAHRLYRRLGFVRTPDRDWYPTEGLSLLTFALALR
ncbi:GNAT family N-acetyltransferase [Streptomyces sp. HK10]|uniref:GNAT family N-acetyltransferase n=1 Tax=Streptomyces sp. HK10 TaxID=3373255 RepID=UPI00374913FE